MRIFGIFRVRKPRPVFHPTVVILKPPLILGPKINLQSLKQLQSIFNPSVLHKNIKIHEKVLTKSKPSIKFRNISRTQKDFVISQKNLLMVPLEERSVQWVQNSLFLISIQNTSTAVFKVSNRASIRSWNQRVDKQENLNPFFLSLNQFTKILFGHLVTFKSVIHGHDLKLCLVDDPEESVDELVSSVKQLVFRKEDILEGSRLVNLEGLFVP